MIYFIRQNDYIKIGFTEDIKGRLSQLQISTPYELNVVLLIPGTMEEEQQLHSRFRADKIRGEWFAMSTELLDYIRRKDRLDTRYEYGLLDKDGLDPNVQTAFIRNMEGWTLREVGEELDITPQSVKEIETRELHGTVSLGVLRKYGEAMGYDLVYKFIKNDSE